MSNGRSLGLRECKNYATYALFLNIYYVASYILSLSSDFIASIPAAAASICYVNNYVN